MNYKEKYEQALERAKDMLAYKEVCQEDMEYLFPELKESKDERIRKTLIEYIKGIKSWNYFLGISKGQMISWLEKQGEQSVEPKWCHHKVDLSDCSEEYRKAYYDGWNNCNMQHSQREAESNNEDERMRKEIIDFLRLPHPQFVGKRDHEKWIDWLEKQGEQKTKPKFKVGDRVVINCREEFSTAYNGKEGTIINIFDLEKNHWGNIVVVLDNGMRNTFYTSELIKK